MGFIWFLLYVECNFSSGTILINHTTFIVGHTAFQICKDDKVKGILFLYAVEFNKDIETDPKIEETSLEDETNLQKQ